jgi:predicted glycosyltransferase
MKVGIFINTPSQFHFYRNVIRNLEKDGNETFLLARNYGETLTLLEEQKMPYFAYSFPTAAKSGKIISLPSDVLRAYRFLKDKGVDAVTGFGIYNTLTAKLLGVNDVIFNDSEPLLNPFYSIQVRIFMQFTDVLITPSSYRQDLGYKHVRVDGYKEVSYLHPKYYMPDEGIFDLMGIKRSEDYVVLRFNAFDALHDVGIGGFSDEEKVELVREMEKHAHVFITSEIGLPAEIRDRALSTPKSRIHDVLYYARLLVTDASTIAAEAAILGTPAVRTNKFVRGNDAGNYIELENKYGLMFNIADSKAAIRKAAELVEKPGLKAEWQERRKAFFNDSIDVASFMSWLIETYPGSFTKLKATPAITKQFI